MGFKVPKDTPPMERELIYLLADLCIPPDDFEQISKMDYYSAQDFAMDVIKAEGMDGNSQWINKVANRFRERFGTHEIHSSTFVDRIRGQKEDWSN